MKTRYRISTLMVIFVIGFLCFPSLETNAYGRNRHHWKNHNDYNDQHYHNRGDNDCNQVGVPLDGGLLALVAGAGITYFAVRRKRKTQE